jgi:N-formylglutamate deformylase
MAFAPEDALSALLPEGPPTPVVVSVPHAGTEVGPFGAALVRGFDVRCDADLFVDELYEGAPRGAFVRARLSRFVCDLNRHPDDVSARAVPGHPAPRNQDGRGFVWEVNTTGAAALARPLELPEWQARRELHAAYHGTLARALEAARARFGYAILVDGHSMPSVGRQGHVDTGRPRAEIVPGDRDGTSCGQRLSAIVGEHFRAHGFSVAFNDPYKGGFITTHHGRPAQGIHAIQIEMRRDLYMDERRFAPVPAGMARVKATLAALLRALDAFDPR